jgi:hypothetical protein
MQDRALKMDKRQQVCRFYGGHTYNHDKVLLIFFSPKEDTLHRKDKRRGSTLLAGKGHFDDIH